MKASILKKPKLSDSVCVSASERRSSTNLKMQTIVNPLRLSVPRAPAPAPAQPRGRLATARPQRAEDRPSINSHFDNTETVIAAGTLERRGGWGRAGRGGAPRRPLLREHVCPRERSRWTSALIDLEKDLPRIRRPPRRPLLREHVRPRERSRWTSALIDLEKDLPRIRIASYEYVALSLT
ncbi:hypothetical protein EVAR_61096_1 [Eumeta japonica]|uniref:Uncharacterized protein n=1 Tax=Eumeta variegata TaxID=151549 RepID=A0A4C1YQC7_EUMVA|nr:hypothetical protein EVAR_61096_1 [Eumeta japonica]